MQLSDLSFVTLSDPNPAKRTYWARLNGKDWADANTIGRQRAEELATYITETGDMAALCNICTAIGGGVVGGVEAGFYARLSMLIHGFKSENTSTSAKRVDETAA